MLLRIPRRAEAQWLRCKAALREQLAPAGQANRRQRNSFSAAVALLETVLKEAGPGADEASPVYEAPAPAPVPLPFGRLDDVFARHTQDKIDRRARSAERRRDRSDRSDDVADIAARIDDLGVKVDALGAKVDALADALVGANK